MTASSLPETVRIIEETTEQGLQRGFQLYVSQYGEIVADAGFGEARPGIPMTSDSITLWLSAGKPVTAVAILQLWESGRLGLDDPVQQHIPEFAGEERAEITIRHLLTHTVGIKQIAHGWPQVNWETIIERICDAPLLEEWPPGKRAAYQPSLTWFLLGEIIQRITGRNFSDYIGQQVFLPCGMEDSWNGMPQEVFDGYGDRISMMYQRERNELKTLDWHEGGRCTAPSPGSNCRGPARELGRFYEMLLHGGKGPDDINVLKSTTVELMTRRVRENLFDETLQFLVDFGLGVIINSNRYGADKVPYGFGPYAGDHAFGHGGSQSSIGFADPDNGLVIVAIANGMAGEPKHQRRARAINAAIYEDLGLHG
ncbi:Penicillin-binding protein 4* [Polystyrenella longa]|uniref:Penicillin-binding protein 4 n=1 Tax=Polystyrenella longa TaxID=2528007 RepID=A0A518CKI1_9PLAN|nr:serine hydrolase domain-containing protein [Polystyrenella longa]QDU79727.1 Penicillin-binding protein 4* [Polystyrenella longa]